MDERTFHLRSRARYLGDDNDQAEIAFELEGDEGWSELSLGLSTPPFRAFVCAALLCQHAYLRMNANERDLLLDRVHGELWVMTEDWVVRELRAEFRATLHEGEPTDDDVEYISSRMRDCPVSRNLPNARKQTDLEFVAEL